MTRYLITVALASTTFGLIKVGGGLTASVATALVVGTVAFVAFLAVEHRRPHPLLPLRLTSTLRLFASMPFTTRSNSAGEMGVDWWLWMSTTAYFARGFRCSAVTSVDFGLYSTIVGGWNSGSLPWPA